MGDSAAPAPKKHGGLAPAWKPGQSGNPAGRPKGSRNKLGDAFIEALHDDFQEHGPAAVVRVREEEPAQYLRVIASLVPRDVHITDATLADMNDNELVEYYAAVRSLAAAINGKAARRRDRETATEENTSPTGRPH